jgi:hypothetical protein
MTFRKIKSDPRQRALFFNTGGALHDKKREDTAEEVLEIECPVCSGTGHARADITQSCFKCGGQGYMQATPQTLTQTLREPKMQPNTVNSLKEIENIIDPATLKPKAISDDKAITLRDVYNLLQALFELNTKIYEELTTEREDDDAAPTRRRYDTKAKIIEAMRDGRSWSIFQLWEHLKIEEPKIGQNAISSASRIMWQEGQLVKLQKGIYKLAEEELA